LQFESENWHLNSDKYYSTLKISVFNFKKYYLNLERFFLNLLSWYSTLEKVESKNEIYNFQIINWVKMDSEMLCEIFISN